MFIDSHMIQGDMCGNHSEEWKIIKNGRTYFFLWSWGPAFDKLYGYHTVSYMFPRPCFCGGFDHYDEIVDADPQMYFKF